MAQELQPFGEELLGPQGLVLHELAPFGACAPGLDVGLGDAEALELLLRQVDAAEPPVLANVSDDVDLLEG